MLQRCFSLAVNLTPVKLRTFDFQVQTPAAAMNRHFRTLLTLAFAFGLQTALSSAQSDVPMDPDHVELRALGKGLIDGIEKGDMDLIEPLLHPNVVVTWQDGQVCKGPAAIRKFYADMAAKSKKTFQGYKVRPTADEPTILYSNATAGVVYGHNVGRFFLMGKEFEMPNRWTATMVKENGKWLLASYHVSMNVLDNPLLNTVKNVAIIGVVLGAVAGALIMWVVARKKRTV